MMHGTTNIKLHYFAAQNSCVEITWEINLHEQTAAFQRRILETERMETEENCLNL